MQNDCKYNYIYKYSRDNYFFSGNLLGVNKFGKNNETLFAISPHGFYVFVYRAYPTIIICNSNDIESGIYQANVIKMFNL